MAYPRVGQAFQLPIGSNKSSMDQVSSISVDGLTILCIRSSGNQLQLRSFYQCNRSVIVGSLRLSLPRETSNRVVSSFLLSIYPRLLVTILTLTGTLITLDLSRFLIMGCLPEITQSEVKESKSHVDCLLTPTRRLSLFDLSVGSQDRSDSSGAANLGTDSNGKFGRYLQTSLTLEQTLKLAINIEELGHHLNEAEATNFPLCIESFSRNRYDTSEKHATVGPRCGGNVPIQQLIIKSSVGCQNGFLLIFERQVSYILITRNVQ